MNEVKGRSVYTGKNIRISMTKGVITTVDETGNQDNLPFISSGFIDTQFNGYAGLDYSSENLEQKDILKLTELLASAGTSCHFSTIVTSSGKVTVKNLQTISQTLEKHPKLVEAIPGMVDK